MWIRLLPQYLCLWLCPQLHIEKYQTILHLAQVLAYMFFFSFFNLANCYGCIFHESDHIKQMTLNYTLNSKLFNFGKGESLEFH